MPLITALQNPEIYPHPVTGFRLIETHISWVLLTGRFAYKLKKPVDLGFLDFSTLDKRRHYCEEELRLNRRLAPQLYLEVVAITGQADRPSLDGDGAPIEFAVKMCQFDPEAQLDHLLERGELTHAHIDELARVVADFHSRIDVAGLDRPFGSPEAVHSPVRENFEQLRRADSALGDHGEFKGLAALENWSEARFECQRGDFEARKADGFVRECHGDMHLRNMVLIEGQVVVFDCIEFNENLRWIDVMSEVAFVDMDLRDRAQPELAQRFLNAYLETTGDYPGLRVLPYYRVYRALVRAKVAAIRLMQHDLGAAEKRAVNAECGSYMALAREFTLSRAPLLIITHGLSGSGKTTYSQELLEAMQAIRIRSDVERKRIFGVATADHAAQGIDAGLYSREASIRTYDRLAELALPLLEQGFDVIVDAAFLRRAQRARFRDLAEHTGVGFAILACEAPAEVLRERIGRRQAGGRDASDAGLAVLEHQLEGVEPLVASERDDAIVIDHAHGMDIAMTTAALGTRRRGAA